MVGTTRFELATSSTPRKRSTKLSYVPKTISLYSKILFESSEKKTNLRGLVSVLIFTQFRLIIEKNGIIDKRKAGKPTEKMSEPQNKQYRDSVFRHYFKDKTRLLSLCNAVLDTDYTDTDELEIKNLDEAVFNGQKNDIGCVIGGKFLVLIEHQSTVNENMPLRCLSYVTEILNGLIGKKRAIYQRAMIKFPAPEFVVFYNGDETEPLKREMRLSDAFLADTRSLELVVTAYNINFGLSQPIVGKCKYLHDYSFLVDRVKKGKADGLSTNQAIREAVKYCIEHGIMSDYLNEHAEEVFRMSIDAWDINEAKYYWKEEAREEGMEEGVLISLKNLMKNTNWSLEKAMDVLQISGDDRKKYSGLIGA